jgi:hypothetical protein
MTVQNWYLGNQYHVEQIKTSDGKVVARHPGRSPGAGHGRFCAAGHGADHVDGRQQTALAPVLAASWH